MKPFLPEHLFGVEVRGIRTQPRMRNPDDLLASKCVLTESSQFFPNTLGKAGYSEHISTHIIPLSLSLKEGFNLGNLGAWASRSSSFLVLE